MTLLPRSVWFVCLGTAVVLVALAILAGPSQAAFTGSNGLLAVQPLNGLGVVLVRANGGGESRVCAEFVHGPVCSLSGPRWSPDGRTLVVGAQNQNGYFAGGEGFDVIYPDGSCLACDGTAGPAAVFTNDSTLLTAVVSAPQFLPPPLTGVGLFEFGVDGLLRKLLVSGAVSDPAWSSLGELAVVRGGWIWVGVPGKLRRLTRGSAPSWSPDGRQIVFVGRGWLTVVRIRGRSLRRLARGTAPAWSPDGRWVAFFDRRHRLSLVRAGGGHVRRLGDVTGVTVDWQPLPAKPPAACPTPPGSAAVASSNTGTVSVDTGQALAPQGGWQNTTAAIGCLVAVGRERVLISSGLGEGSNSIVSEAVVAGDYAALAVHGVAGKYVEGVFNQVTVFDLRTGVSVPGRGGESAQTSASGCSCDARIDQLVLGSDAVSAVHTTVTGEDANGHACSCTVGQIQASDSTGVNTLDSVTEPNGAPDALTNLTLTGDTLTWNHNGSPRSAQLHPWAAEATLNPPAGLIESRRLTRATRPVSLLSPFRKGVMAPRVGSGSRVGGRSLPAVRCRVRR